MKPIRLACFAAALAALPLLFAAAGSTPAEAHGRYYRSFGYASGYHGFGFARSSYGHRRYARHATFGGYRYGHLRGGLGISLRSGR